MELDAPTMRVSRRARAFRVQQSASASLGDFYGSAPATAAARGIMFFDFPLLRGNPHCGGSAPQQECTPVYEGLLLIITVRSSLPSVMMP